MAEKFDDLEIELPEEDSPIEILNKPLSEDKFDFEQESDDSPDGLENLDLDDMLPNNEENKSNVDEEEIDLGMDEIGDLVDDLKLDVQNDETKASEEGEEDMVFEEEENDKENMDSVESLLDDLGEDESEDEAEEIPTNLSDSEGIEEILEDEASPEDSPPEETSPEDSSLEEVNNESQSEKSSVSQKEGLNESEVDSDSSEILDMLHDPETPETGEGKDNEDVELGMESLDDTKADVTDELDIEETEIEESSAEELGIVNPDNDSTEEWFSDSETKEDTAKELEEMNREDNSLESSEADLSEEKSEFHDEGKKEITSESDLNETTPSPLGSDMLLNFHHEVVVEIARTQLTGEEITQITYGSIIELDKPIGEPVDLVLDGKTIAHGEVVQINKEKLGIRIVGVAHE